MITVGFDFGTHQTKVCVENKKGVELSYEFLKFKDDKGKLQYTLPSIIQIDKSGRMAYGYIPSNRKGEIIRYFKQAVFTNVSLNQSQNEAIYYSIWYIAYILFELEELYSTDFVIQMGVPTDGGRFAGKKQLAVRVLASAYRLVEDVFENDKEAFLNSTIDELIKKTEFVEYSKELKDEYSMLVFPEAYACLMPLISSSKVSNGMSLMIDIGGGTTDISFFTIKDNKPQVYDFMSVDKGLNFLTDVESILNERLDSNVYDSSEIKENKRIIFKNEINQKCVNLIGRLRKEFGKQCGLRIDRLMDALHFRPIIYTGGGSTFAKLRSPYGGFVDVIHISDKEWRTKAVKELNTIKGLGLCPILSTAYGLSISVPNDNIKCEPFHDIFKSLRGKKEHKSEKSYVYGKKFSDTGFNYADDYDAWK